MDMHHLRILWEELAIQQGNNPKIYLKHMFRRFKSEAYRGGLSGLEFEHYDENLNPYILRMEELPKEHIFYYWDNEAEEWDNIGRMVFINEWGLGQLERHWKNCAIKLKNPRKTIEFKNMFSQCLSQKSGGILFIGKGEWEGESFILKLDQEKLLDRYMGPQKCYRLNRDTDEWEEFGLFLKDGFSFDV